MKVLREVLSSVLLTGIFLALLQAKLNAQEPSETEGARFRVLATSVKKEDLFYQLFIVPPQNGPTLVFAGIERKDDTGWVEETVDRYVIKPQEMQVAFIAGYDGTVRFIFSKRDAADHRWFSKDSYTVRNGIIVQTAGEALSNGTYPNGADQSSVPTEINITLKKNGSRYELVFPQEYSASELKLSRVVEDGDDSRRYDSDFWNYDVDTQILEFRLGFAHVYDKIRWPVRLIFENGSRIYQSQPLGANQITRPVSQVGSESIFPISPDSDPLRELRAQTESAPEPDKFKSLVIEEAKAWREFHPSGRSLVFRYDHYPEKTAREIAKILRRAASRLESMELDDAKDEMQEDFEEFYEGGQSRFTSENIYVTDWQKFLRHLRQVVEAKISEAKVPPDEAKAYYRIVLIDIAAGFEELASLIESGEAPIESPPGVLSPTVYGPAYAPSGGLDDSKKRRRIKCWDILFGL